jgi:hypothetical protein
MCVEGSGGYKSDETIKLFLAQQFFGEKQQSR